MLNPVLLVLFTVYNDIFIRRGEGFWLSRTSVNNNNSYQSSLLMNPTLMNDRQTINLQSKKQSRIYITCKSCRSQNLPTHNASQDRMLRFIIDVWARTVACRQVLQWTYAYGYFIPENGRLKVRLFEHLQGHAEFSLERLHKCAERELQHFLVSAGEASQGEGTRSHRSESGNRYKDRYQMNWSSEIRMTNNRMNLVRIYTLL